MLSFGKVSKRFSKWWVWYGSIDADDADSEQTPPVSTTAATGVTQLDSL